MEKSLFKKKPWEKTAFSKSEFWDESYAQRPFELRVPGDALKDDIIAGIIAKESNPESKILDLGCGMGHCSLKLSKLGKVFGVDYSRKAIETAKKHVNAEFKVAKAEHLPFKNEFFDFIVAKDLIEHVPNDLKVLKEIERVAKRNAKVIIYAPFDLNKFSYSTEFIVKKIFDYSLDPEVGHLRRYTPESLSRLLKKSGLKPGEFFYCVHYALGAVALASVLGFRKVKSRKQGIKGFKLYALKTAFKILETFGRAEQALLKKTPGAGFFIIAEKG